MECLVMIDGNEAAFAAEYNSFRTPLAAFVVEIGFGVLPDR